MTYNVLADGVDVRFESVEDALNLVARLTVWASSEVIDATDTELKGGENVEIVYGSTRVRVINSARCSINVGETMTEALSRLGLEPTGDPPDDIHVGLYFRVAGSSLLFRTVASLQRELGLTLERHAAGDQWDHWNRPRVYTTDSGAHVVVCSDLNNDEWASDKFLGSAAIRMEIPGDGLELPTETFWIDEVGDRLQAEGVDPGCIWETSFSLGDDLLPGAVIETTCAPGVRPRLPTEIRRVIVQKRHGLRGREEIEMSGLRPLVVANFHLLLSDMN